MRDHLRPWWGLLVLLAAVTARAETLAEVEKKLLDAHARLQSYTARIQRVEDVSLPGGAYRASKSRGTVEWMRRGDKILYRLETIGASTQKSGPDESTVEQSSILVADEKLFYTLSEQAGQKRFIKQNRDISINGDIRSVLEILRPSHDFRLAPDDKVDGADCHVIEAAPKTAPADDAPVHRTLIYFRKDIGLNVKTVNRNKAGKDVYVHTLLDIKPNAPIDASRFVLPVPPGVPVTDLTE